MDATVDHASEHYSAVAEALPHRLRELEQGPRVRRLHGLHEDAQAGALLGRGDELVGGGAVDSLGRAPRRLLHALAEAGDGRTTSCSGTRSIVASSPS